MSQNRFLGLRALAQSACSRLYDPLPAKQLPDVLGAVNHSQDFDAAIERPVEDQNLLEAGDAKKPKATQRWKPKLWIPAYVWSGGEE